MSDSAAVSGEQPGGSDLTRHATEILTHAQNLADRLRVEAQFGKAQDAAVLVAETQCTRRRDHAV